MKLAKLTESEQLVMKCVWMKDKHMSLPEIVSLANEHYSKEWKPQTVSTFLNHLVKKGFLNLYRDGRTFRYQPLIKEEEYSSFLLKSHIEFWNNNSIEAFAMSLCKKEVVSKEKRAVLKKLLDELED
ncbi:MAG: BlaI/MecI/CopY family transcriptional regulator [Lachnospiraceae bacterium]|nr:BlaI/MecI/CopY family transcriptional regulator [Lachnospiraceae bacterium]